MSRFRFLAVVPLVGALSGAPVLAGAARAASGPVACSGTGSFGPSGAVISRSAGGEVIVSFPFDGVHPYCPAPGGVDDVQASIAGTLSEEITAQGHFALQFAETLTLPGGSGADQWRGEASGTISNGLPVVLVSEVRTVGTGTGELAGVVGHGRFQITGFGGYGLEFSDEIFYLYP